MKKILITGATGFLGLQLLKQLVQYNVEVTAIIRSDGDKQLLAKYNVDKFVTSENIFLESIDWWLDRCRDIDTVIHAAWFVSPKEYLDSQLNLDCLTGSLALAKACVAAGVKKFVGVGTCFEYDVRFGRLYLDTPLNPQTVYAGSKAALYFALSNYLSIANVDFAWCRLFYLFGENEKKERLIASLHSRLSNGIEVPLSDGKQIRDYLDVSVAAEQLTSVALGDRCGVVNICSGEGKTVREIALRIAAIYDAEHLLKFGARKNNSFDPPIIIGFDFCGHGEAN